MPFSLCPSSGGSGREPGGTPVAIARSGGRCRRGAEVRMNSRETLVRIVLVALLMYSMASLTAAAWQLRQASVLLERLELDCAAVENQNGELERKMQQGQSPDELRQLARERLGLVQPGEKLFYFSTDREG